MDVFLFALLGGLFIGLSAAIYLLYLGRIAGISGMLSAIVSKDDASIKILRMNNYPLLFITGIILGSAISFYLFQITFEIRTDFSIPLLVISGLLVGYGTQLGNGCTSGHGVCGIGRKSKRSIISTIIFMIFAMITALISSIIFK
jgi:uncharacterized membrane protein YedE/YeeE